MIDERVQQELLALDWMDFSIYPRHGQSILVHAKGFDTHERTWKHVFVEVESFDPLHFPTDKMNDTLNQHHCKWTFEWLPSKTEN